MELLFMKAALSLRGVLVASAILAPANAYADPGSGGPFLALSGQWSGVGTITMADRPSERLRCKVANAVNAHGKAIQRNLRCTSDSSRLDIRSNVVAKGGMLSGSWAEMTRGVSGTVFGRASGSAIDANVAGHGFAARIDVRTKGDKQSVTMQSVTIRPHSGTDVASLSVVLHR